MIVFPSPIDAAESIRPFIVKTFCDLFCNVETGGKNTHSCSPYQYYSTESTDGACMLTDFILLLKELGEVCTVGCFFLLL